MNDIDMTANCDTCKQPIEHFAGVQGSTYMTPFWRHLDGSVQNHPHPAVPELGTEREANR